MSRYRIHDRVAVLLLLGIMLLVVSAVVMLLRSPAHRTFKPRNLIPDCQRRAMCEWPDSVDAGSGL